MASAPNDPRTNQQRAQNDAARRKLAQGWGAMTASMANPGSPAEAGVEAVDNAVGSTGGRPKPVPAAPGKVTPLPLPAPPQQRPAPPPLPTPQAAPAAPSPAPPTRPPASAAPTVPVVPTGPAMAAAPPAPAQVVPTTPAAPVATQPRRAAPPQQPQPQPQPAPALRPPAAVQVEQPQLLQPGQQAAAKAPEPAEAEISRERLVIAAAISWTVFALVVAIIITFVNGTSGNAFTDLGPGPFPAAFVSIVCAWLIVLSARMLGRTWPAWYIVPLLVLVVGPVVNNRLWQSGQTNAARAYLSAAGQSVMIDVDPISLTSATVTTPNGCFAVVQARSTRDTTVSVESSSAQTARQHANTALAPRFAARIESGGTASKSHVFLFQRGQAPPVVSAPNKPPLDCAITGR